VRVTVTLGESQVGHAERDAYRKNDDAVG